MQIEVSMVIELAVLAAALTGYAWRYNLYVEKKIEQNRVGAEARIAAVEARLEAVRAESAKREDLHRIETALTGVHERIDQIYTLMLKTASTP